MIHQLWFKLNLWFIAWSFQNEKLLMNLVQQIQTSHSLANVQMRPYCDFVLHKYSGKYGAKLRPVIVKLCHKYIFRYIRFTWTRRTCVQILIFSFSGWSKWRGFNADIHQILVQQQKAHLLSSAYQWCTIFLISVLYKIPVFCDVQYSWLQWCIIFLSSVMHNIPVFHVVPFSCIISDVP